MLFYEQHDGKSRDGAQQTTGSLNCEPNYVYRYTIAVDETIYTLERVTKHPVAAALSLGYSTMTEYHSSLYTLQQGGPILVRFEKNREIIRIRVGKKESRFRILASIAGHYQP